MKAYIILAVLAFIVCPGRTTAQSNAFGIVHLGLAGAGGGYATAYEQTSPGQTIRNEDGAASFSVPIEVHVGLARPFSLGLYLQPGFYLDSSATRTNSFFIAGLSPRFYAVNKDRFNWWVGLDAGLASLVIKDSDGQGHSVQYTFAGGHFRLGSGVTFYLGSLVGIQFGLKYAGYNMPLRDIEPDIPYFDSELKVSGLEAQLGLEFKLGGN